ncbi:unnamed protein product [Bursaphelenchus xylophilus]|uniref:(pine wood nematode) hypothetical protein n=1 Tax=Bursaphelenchus xylophilus TaxID=6326 RepID=A0A1I7RHZ9_BURXY|nr:unnamed protein product [Bursaphelenchus xylophilus]CAG9115259.1 unnamed protein product [Bursaphelenchus xylophilus]
MSSLLLVAFLLLPIIVNSANATTTQSPSVATTVIKLQDAPLTVATLFPTIPTFPPPPTPIVLPTLPTLATLPTLPSLWKILGIPEPTLAPLAQLNGFQKNPQAVTIATLPTLAPWPTLPTNPSGVTVGVSDLKNRLDFDGFIDLMNQVLTQMGKDKVNQAEAEAFAQKIGFTTSSPPKMLHVR